MSLAVTALGGVALGQEDITVLVLEDDNDPSTFLLPIAGAQVMLRGTDAGSIAGLVLTTGPGGTATFNGVSGPYTVTAQKDQVSLGVTTRVASSLIDISPAVTGSPLAGTIGILMIEHLDAPPPTLDATLSGTILNPPALAGAELLEVVVFGSAPSKFQGWANASSGSYSLPVPSGADLHCYAAYRAGPGSAPVISSLLQTGLGPISSGTTLTQDFDFSSPALTPWSTPVNVTVTGTQPGFEQGVQLVLLDTSAGIEIDFSIYDGAAVPLLVNLPDVSAPSFSGFRVEFSAEGFDLDGPLPGEQFCSKLLTSTPGAVTFDLFPLPAPTQPAQGLTFTPAELECLIVSYVEGGTGSFGTNGINLLTFASEDGTSGPPPPGIDQAWWTILVPGGVESFDMPPHILPMFAANQTLFGGVQQYRAKGVSFDYSSFFGANLAANFVALMANATDECEADLDFSFSLSSETYCTAGVSASGCTASISSSGTASATASSGFNLLAAGVEGSKDALFFFGTNGKQANPWGNGTSLQCVVPPVKRAGLLAGSGTNGACDGSFAQDLNARWTGQPAQNPGPGAVVQAQLWYRDPFNTSNQTTSLSDAIEFCVGP